MEFLLILCLIGSKNNLMLLKQKLLKQRRWVRILVISSKLSELSLCFPLRQSSSSSPPGIKLEEHETIVAFSEEGLGLLVSIQA